jgi:cytochrome P450
MAGRLALSWVCRWWTTPWQSPKSLKPLCIQAKATLFVHLSRFIGSESLITRENEEWKALRKCFNPGFQPKHIYSLTPSMAAKTQLFVNRLEEAASDGRTFTLANYAKGLTADVITQLTIERDLQAQSTPEGKGEKALFGILTAFQTFGTFFQDWLGAWTIRQDPFHQTT